MTKLAKTYQFPKTEYCIPINTPLPTQSCASIFCWSTHSLNPSSWMDVGLAIGGMILVDTPLCHNILMPITSLTSSLILHTFTSTAQQLGYAQTFVTMGVNNAPLAGKIHGHFHEAVHYTTAGFSQVVNFASSKLLGNELNNTTHNDEHHDHHENHSLMHVITEPIFEITLGWLASEFSQGKLLKIAHSIDPLHYLLPSWEAVESAAPAIAHGHAMAELFWVTSSFLGPVYDVCVTGLDPAELVNHYATNLWKSGALVVQTVSMPLKWIAEPKHIEDALNKEIIENEIYTDSTTLLDAKCYLAEEAYANHIEMCFPNEAINH